MRFDPARDRLYAVRETHDAAEPARPDLVVNELVAIALDGSDGAGRVLVAGPDFVAAPRPSPDGSLARLAGVGPAGHALGLDLPPRRRRPARRVARSRRGPSPAGPGSRSSSPPGAPTASCTTSRTSRHGGTCTRSTARAASTGRRGTWRRWRPSSATQSWVFGSVLVRVHRRRRGPRRGPRRRSRHAPADHGSGRGLAGPGRGLDVHRGRGPAGGCRDGGADRRPARTTGRSSPGWTRGPGA